MQGPYSTEKEYNKLLIEQIIADFLTAGIVPTYEQIMEEMKARINKDTLDNGPLTDYEEIKVDEREESSVAKFEKLTKNVATDLRVAFNSIVEINDRVNVYFENTSYEMDSISQLLRNAELVIKEGAKFENLEVAYTIESDLSTLDDVDQSRTSAHVDVNKPECELEKTGARRQKFYMSGNPIKLQVQSDNQIVSHGFADNEDVNTLLEDTDRTYLYLVKTLTQQYPVTLDVIIDVRELEQYRRAINQIGGQLVSTTTPKPVDITVSHSIDGYNFIEIASGTFTNQFNFIFDEVTTNYVKVSMVKNSCDDVWIGTDNMYVYEFNLTTISLYYIKYYYTSTLVTKPLYVLDQNASKRMFDAVTLHADQDLNTTKAWEKQTNIQYYISIDKDDDGTLSYKNFIPITPGEKLELDIMRHDLLTGVTISPASISDDTAYLNAHLKANYLPDTFLLWRNIGVPTTNTHTYHGEETGWRKDGSYYKCVFRVDNPDGMIINFGDNGAVIDGAYVSGVTFIENGYHKFKTHEKNWIPLVMSSTDKGDPLYPYNHKLLIEGHPNIDLYAGVDFYAACRMVRVGEFDFYYNVRRNDFEKYYYNESDGRIYVKIPSNEDYECTQRTTDYKTVRELFELDYKYKRSGYNRKNVDQLVLKAVLTTKNDNVSPVLRNYKLQLTYR